MLTIRLNRTGKKNRASFRVVLQEKTKAPNHRHVEVLGSYDPHSKTTVLKGERILYWIGMGAQASDSVHNLLVRQGILKDAKKRAIKMVKPAVKEEVKEDIVAEAKEEKTVEVAEVAAVEAEAKAE
ncbi:MAG: 30S ribosomal protein S16 [Candidatus Moranbacteria bacterium]|nr:30S ribosomal protein S16 [Candidatus Moranbacteria bacterium]